MTSSKAYNSLALRVLCLEAFPLESLYGAARGRRRFPAVSKRKTTSLLFPLALALAILAPHTALGSRLSDAAVGAEGGAAAAPATAAAETGVGETPEAAAEAAGKADEAQTKPKRKGNAFTRAITAPFRALAKLFGGGKSKSETAKKPAETESTKDVEAARNPAPEESKPGKGDAAPLTSKQSGVTAQAAPVEAARVEPLTKTPAPPAASRTPSAPEGVRIVRPSEGEVAPGLQPKMWIPKIVGVPSDSISQGRALL